MRELPAVLRTCCLLVFGSTMAAVSPVGQAQVSNGDAFFGYGRAGSNVPALNSWQANASVKIHKPFFGVEGDFAFYSLGENAPRSTTVLVGPQVALHTAGSCKLFVHALFGVEHAKSRTLNTPIDGRVYAYALGGGLEVPATPHLALRIQGDRLEAPSSRTANTIRTRFSIGGVFRY